MPLSSVYTGAFDSFMRFFCLVYDHNAFESFLSNGMRKINPRFIYLLACLRIRVRQGSGSIEVVSESVSKI